MGFLEFIFALFLHYFACLIILITVKMKKTFTQSQRASLRKSTEKLSENGIVVVYCLANKQSGTGLFSNQRLLLLKSDQKSIRYYSKQPPNLLFTTIAQIPQGKSKVQTEKVKNFKCEAWKGKTSTVKMQWDQNNSWVFSFANAKMMNEWIAAVQQMRAGTINKDPTFILPTNKPADPQLKDPIKSQNNTKPPPISKQPQKAKPSLLDEPVKYNQPLQNSKIQPQKNQPTQPLQNSKNQPQQPQKSQIQQNNNLNPQNPQNPQPSKNTEPLAQKNSSSNLQNTNTQPIQPQKKPSTSQSLLNQEKPPTNNPPTNTNQPLTSSPVQQPPPSNQQPTSTNQQPASTGQPANKPPVPSPDQSRISNQNPPPANSQVNPPVQSPPSSNNPTPFILTKQPSIKNLNQPVKPQESRDNYETKKDPQRTTQQYNLPPPSVKKTTNEAPIIPIQSQNKINNSRELQNPNPIVQSRITNQQPKFQNRPNKQTKLVIPRDESKSKLSSVRTPAQMSQFYPEDEENYDSKSRNMNRVQSQQPNFQQNRYNDSRIRSQYQYNQKNDDKYQRKQPKVVNQHKRWNQLWCGSGKPIQVYQDFIKQCQKISTKIIDELPFIKSSRQFSPLRYQIPYFMYDIQGITYNMHFFGDQNLPLESSRENDERAPLLFDHESYMQSKRQFYNYNFILGVTGNKGFIKVPLCCYIQYKGILIVCRANIPDGFDKISPHHHEKQLQQLEQTIRMRFIFNSMSVYAHPQRKYFLITNLQELIPRIPKQIHPAVYFRKQFLLQNNFLIDDQTSLLKLNQKLINENVKQFVTRVENLQLWIINSNDFLQQLHRSGISAGCLTQIYQSTNFGFFKKIIVSQMAKSVFCDILRSELNSVYATFPAKQFEDLTVQYVQKIILDCAHVMLNQLFSYSSRSQNIWRMIVRQVNKKYKVVISKQDIIPGYLLGGIMSYSGIDCDYKTTNLKRKQTFFIKQNTIPRDLMIGFYPKVRRYDLETVSPLIERISQILSSQPQPDNFEQLVRCLDLKNNDIPSFCHPLRNEIITYMCNFIPLGDHQQFQHIGIYDMLEAQPHTFCTSKISLLAIKWAAKKKNEQLANKIFQIKFQQNSFWVSQFNPAISQYYDFFSLFNISIGNYEEGVKLAKSSLVNSIKLTGPNSLPVADKHYQLGNIFFKIGRKEQALKQYLKTKQILQQNKQTSIPQYGVILLKLSLLYLNFGKISDCVGSSLDALKIFDTNGNNQQEEIQTFQILSRSYQITRKTGDLASVGALCAQKFNKTQNPKIFQRMIKIVMLPKLSTLNHQDAKTLLKLVNKLEQLQSPISYIDAFNYLHSRSLSQVVMKRVFSFLENIFNLYQDVMRKDLLRKHKSLSIQPKSEAAEMLVVLEAIITMTGYNFINGSLRENYY